MASSDPNPNYVPSKTRIVRINGRDCLEIDGQKYVELMRDLAYWAQPKERKGKV